MPAQKPSVIPLLALILVFLALMSAEGVAKGPSLDTEELGYRPGKQATVRTVFGPGAYDGRVGDGPFYAYLLPYDERLTPGAVPDEALRVGKIRIVEIRPAVWKASLRFRVPHKPPGLYRLDYCDIPCTVEGVGDLEPGALQIVQTAQRDRLDRLHALVQRLRDHLRDVLDQRPPVLGKVEGGEAEAPEPFEIDALGVLAVAVASVALILSARMRGHTDRVPRGHSKESRDRGAARGP